MKRFHLTLAFALAILCVLYSHVFAQENQTKKAEWLIKQITQGSNADLNIFCAGENTGECRTLDASVLREALLEKSATTDQQIVVSGAKIRGDLILSGASIGQSPQKS